MSDKPALTLDAADDDFSPESVYTMTPRSNEACKQLGVLPFELIVK